jgi:hypothetical protein
MDEKVNLKPYRKALEALLSHHTESKMSAFLGSAAANLDDPWLRNHLKAFIDKIDPATNSYGEKGPKRLHRMVAYIGNPEQRLDSNKVVSELIEYIERVIDADESAWEIIASEYGWEPTDQSD